MEKMDDNRGQIDAITSKRLKRFTNHKLSRETQGKVYSLPLTYFPLRYVDKVRGETAAKSLRKRRGLPFEHKRTALSAS